MSVTDDGRRDSLLAPDAESLPQAAGQAHANMQPKLERLPCARVQEFRDAILPLFRRVAAGRCYGAYKPWVRRCNGHAQSNATR